MNAAPLPVLRPATVADAALALAWTPEIAALRRWAGPHMDYPASPEAFWTEITGQGSATYVLASPADGAVAFGQVRLREQTCGHLARLIVAPAHRGRGLGRLLCHSLMREALRLHPALEAFTLYVLPDNGPALALYRSLGFVERGVHEKFNCLLMRAPRSALPAG